MGYAISLHLKLRGKPALTVGGKEITRFRTDKVWLLLGYLAYRDGWVPRSELCDMIWPGVEAAHARLSLRQTLFIIRRTSPDLVLAQDDYLRLGELQHDLHSGEEPLLEAFADPWIVRAAGDIEDQATVDIASLPTLLIRTVDEETARRLAPGLVAAWRAAGKAEEGLEEIGKLRRVSRMRDDMDLALSEVELLILAGNLFEAEASLTAALNNHHQDSPNARATWLRGSIQHRQNRYTEAALTLNKSYRLGVAEGDTSTAIESLRTLTSSLFLSGDSMRARATANRGRRHAADLGDPLWDAIFRFAIGFYEWSESKNGAALGNIQGAIKGFRVGNRPGDTGLYIARSGRVFEGLGLLDTARDCYRTAEEQLRPTDCRRELAETLTYLGDLLNQSGEHPEALAIHLEGVAIRRPMRDPLALATSLRGAGIAAAQMGHGFQAQEYLRASVDQFELAGNPAGVASALICEARLLEQTKKLKEARELLKRAIAIYEKVSPELLLARTPDAMSHDSALGMLERLGS